MHGMIFVVMGLVTGVFGGTIRDVLSGKSSDSASKYYATNLYGINFIIHDAAVINPFLIEKNSIL